MCIVLYCGHTHVITTCIGCVSVLSRGDTVHALVLCGFSWSLVVGTVSSGNGDIFHHSQLQCWGHVVMTYNITIATYQYRIFTLCCFPYKRVFLFYVYHGERITFSIALLVRDGRSTWMSYVCLHLSGICFCGQYKRYCSCQPLSTGYVLVRDCSVGHAVRLLHTSGGCTAGLWPSPVSAVDAVHPARCTSVECEAVPHDA